MFVTHSSVVMSDMVLRLHTTPDAAGEQHGLVLVPRTTRCGHLL